MLSKELSSLVEKLITPGPNYKNESLKFPQYSSAPAYTMGTRTRNRRQDKVHLAAVIPGREWVGREGGRGGKREGERGEEGGGGEGGGGGDGSK